MFKASDCRKMTSEEARNIQITLTLVLLTVSVAHLSELRCRAGFYRHCNDNDYVTCPGAQCVHCPEEQYNTKNNNMAMKCAACSRCYADREEEHSACTPQSNRKCQCKEGFYPANPPPDLRCVLIVESTCQPGYRLIRPGLVNDPIQCEPCEPGYTSTGNTTICTALGRTNDIGTTTQSDSNEVPVNLHYAYGFTIIGILILAIVCISMYCTRKKCCKRRNVDNDVENRDVAMDTTGNNGNNSDGQAANGYTSHKVLNGQGPIPGQLQGQNGGPATALNPVFTPPTGDQTCTTRNFAEHIANGTVNQTINIEKRPEENEEQKPLLEPGIPTTKQRPSSKSRPPCQPAAETDEHSRGKGPHFKCANKRSLNDQAKLISDQIAVHATESADQHTPHGATYLQMNSPLSFIQQTPKNSSLHGLADEKDNPVPNVEGGSNSDGYKDNLQMKILKEATSNTSTNKLPSSHSSRPPKHSKASVCESTDQNDPAVPHLQAHCNSDVANGNLQMKTAEKTMEMACSSAELSDESDIPASVIGRKPRTPATINITIYQGDTHNYKTQLSNQTHINTSFKVEQLSHDILSDLKEPGHVFTNLWTELVSEVIITELFLGYLIQDSVLQTCQSQAITQSGVCEEQVAKLLRIIKRAGDKGLQSFVSALRKTGQGHVADKLRDAQSHLD